MEASRCEHADENGLAAKQRENVKRREPRGIFFCNSPTHDFRPFVVEAQGRLGPSALLLLQELAEIAAQRRGRRLMEQTKQFYLEKWLKQLSCIMQYYLANVKNAACITALESGSVDPPTPQVPAVLEEPLLSNPMCSTIVQELPHLIKVEAGTDGAVHAHVGHLNREAQGALVASPMISPTVMGEEPVCEGDISEFINSAQAAAAAKNIRILPDIHAGASSGGEAQVAKQLSSPRVSSSHSIPSPRPITLFSEQKRLQRAPAKKQGVPTRSGMQRRSWRSMLKRKLFKMPKAGSTGSSQGSASNASYQVPDPGYLPCNEPPPPKRAVSAVTENEQGGRTPPPPPRWRVPVTGDMPSNEPPPPKRVCYASKESRRGSHTPPPPPPRPGRR